MSVFCDSSALVKLYVDEADHELIRELAVIVISDLARVEVASAIWRKHRLGEIEREDAAVLIGDFEADLAADDVNSPRFSTVAPGRSVLDRAAELVEQHGLRAYDAVQLGSAAIAREVDPDCGEFACFDQDLRSAAEAVGFDLIPASPEPAAQQAR
ncbi:MAG: type II toxin-antitoxin system VapC family toxin [Solirubrobacterales bacterium]